MDNNLYDVIEWLKNGDKSYHKREREILCNRPNKNDEIKITAYMIRELAKTHWFVSDKQNNYKLMSIDECISYLAKQYNRSLQDMKERWDVLKFLREDSIDAMCNHLTTGKTLSRRDAIGLQLIKEYYSNLIKNGNKVRRSQAIRFGSVNDKRDSVHSIQLIIPDRVYSESVEHEIEFDETMKKVLQEKFFKIVFHIVEEEKNDAYFRKIETAIKKEDLKVVDVAFDNPLAFIAENKKICLVVYGNNVGLKLK